MRIRSLFLFAALLLAGLSACLDDNGDYLTIQEQLELDVKAIDAYLDTNGIDATEHPSGLRYMIVDPGAGDSVYDSNTIVVKYTGWKIADSALIDQSASATFVLNELIVGWRIGIPLISKGGKITLYIPRVYAYGRDNLMFDIELLDVK